MFSCPNFGLQYLYFQSISLKICRETKASEMNGYLGIYVLVSELLSTLLQCVDFIIH